MLSMSNQADNFMEKCRKCPCCCVLSPVRRVFVVTALFDMLLVTLLWILYAQLSQVGVQRRIILEVKQYTFSSSLFDLVLLSCCRAIFLLLVYTSLMVEHWWAVAVSTVVSSSWCLAKVFFFEFRDSVSSHPIDYCLVLTSFVIPWIEVWQLDVKIMPDQNDRLEDNSHEFGTFSFPNRWNIISSKFRRFSEQQSCYYSPMNRSPSRLSLAENDDNYLKDEDLTEIPPVPVDPKLRSAGDALVAKVKEILAAENGWGSLSNKDDMTMDCQHFSNIGMVFRCRTTVHATHCALKKILWDNFDHQQVWNMSVIESRVLKSFGPMEDVCYSVSADAMNGMIRSRDFVVLRRCIIEEGITLCCGVSVQIPEMPPCPKLVRGENGPGGYVLRWHPDDPERTHLTWLLNTDLKGWLPKKLVEQALSSAMMEGIAGLKRFVATVCDTPCLVVSSDSSP